METTTHSNVHVAGPMERDKWPAALPELSDRLDSIERLQRLHAQSIVHIEEQTRQVYGKVREAVKLSDEARVVDYNNLNGRVSLPTTEALASSASLMMRSMALRSNLQNAI